MQSFFKAVSVVTGIIVSSASVTAQMMNEALNNASSSSTGTIDTSSDKGSGSAFFIIVPVFAIAMAVVRCCAFGKNTQSDLEERLISQETPEDGSIPPPPSPSSQRA
jgi:hypothetical protein